MESNGCLLRKNEIQNLHFPVIWIPIRHCYLGRVKKGGEEIVEELTRMFIYLASPHASAKFERKSFARAAGKKMKNRLNQIK